MKDAAATVTSTLASLVVLVALSAALLYLGAAVVPLMLDVLVAGWESV